MKLKKGTVKRVVDDLDALCRKVRKGEKNFKDALEKVDPAFRRSARNLVHYFLIRNGGELGKIQDDLAELGFAGLGDLEGHILAGLMTIRDTLRRLVGLPDGGGKAPVTRRQEKRLLQRNTTALFGKKIKGSKTRIMVTLPSEAADNPALTREWVAAGMNAARVNCAHDDLASWEKMIANVRATRRKTGRSCRVAADLGGPKIRTGALAEGPRVLHIHPERDALGRVTAPTRLPLGLDSAGGALPVVGAAFLETLKPGDRVSLIDARGKKCHFPVTRLESGAMALSIDETVYLTPNTPLVADRSGRRIAAGLTGEIPPLEHRLVLKVGDELLLQRDDAPGGPAEFDRAGNCRQPARIACTAPEVFDDVVVGQPILFDDGKIEGEIVAVTSEGLRVKILHTRAEVARLGADKGINFPATRFKMSGLTGKDREDLAGLAKHLDIVNMSFVNTPEDVLELHRRLEALKAEKVGVILKIETRQGYCNLPAILLAAMQRHPAGVMLARGDLAVECGWENLAPIQEEILRLCNAAHIPVVWATQVLETSAQKGIPTRAEITDAAMAERAECVMLNKGPHIRKTIALLERILTDIRKLRHKTEPLLPPLAVPAYPAKKAPGPDKAKKRKPAAARREKQPPRPEGEKETKEKKPKQRQRK